jgi:hypothetical protein
VEEVALAVELGAADEDLGALGDGIVDVGLYFADGLGVDQRAVSAAWDVR